MKPGRFVYHCPSSVPEALDLLREHAGEVKVLAGGQSLMPLLNFRMSSPEHLVDINRLPGLDTPVRTQTGWRIPALVRQRHVERSTELERDLPLLRQALVNVAHPQIRNRGTICGSLAHADPAAELPAVMVALDARMHVVSKDAERTVPAAEFFVFHLTTVLAEDELLLAVEIDVPRPGTRTAFLEFATRHGDFALASVAAVLTQDDDGLVTDCRLVASGVAATPQRLAAAEQAVLGGRLEPDVLAAVEQAVLGEIEPTGDVHASADYRRQLVGVLAKRALAGLGSQSAEGAGHAAA